MHPRHDDLEYRHGFVRFSAVRAGVFIAANLLLLFAAAGASAQARRPAAPGLFFANATLGIGDCAGTLCGPGNDNASTAPLPGIGIGVYVRPIPYFAAGLELHHQWMSAEDGRSDRFSEGATDVIANLALRGILPLGIVEPWIGVGLGYAWWRYAWEKDKKVESLSIDGTNFAFSLGVDVNVAPHWSVGGMFRYALPSWGTRCKESIDISDGKLKRECKDVDALDAEDRAELPDSLWYLGATVRFEFGG